MVFRFALRAARRVPVLSLTAAAGRQSKLRGTRGHMIDDRSVIVIGSGPCGAMAALTLLNEGIPVTMLESGERFPGGLLIRLMGRNVYRRRPPLAEDRNHTSSHGGDVVWYRSLVPGGLSNYWTGAVPRFTPEDFFEGERLHEQYRWPVSYDNLVPY